MELRMTKANHGLDGANALANAAKKRVWTREFSTGAPHYPSAQLRIGQNDAI